MTLLNDIILKYIEIYEAMEALGIETVKGHFDSNSQGQVDKFIETILEIVNEEQNAKVK